ncbi:MAG: tRNA (adenosine(37)-N6)-threonylcarbamoyltransferase complex dimerization subunit type 1 TsaB [Spirochaetes bacterium]|nr:tRNA (adenosine(37)-N6)-threonylcarbamoyltransferase complex dimerization subunit type 1 TsaB [Spirochaetota bacterium]
MNVLGIDCSTDVLCVVVRRESAEGAPVNPLDANGAFSARRRAKHPFREPDGHGWPPGIGSVVLELDVGLRHAERLIGAIDFALGESGLCKGDLGLLACASGPGSFTGLRIACATTKGLSDALGIPFVMVPTLDCLARERFRDCQVIIPVIDARRGRFFSAVYENGTRVSDWLDASLASIVALADTYPDVLFTGPDADYFESAAAERTGFRIARHHRRAPARSLVEAGMELFQSSGPSAADAGPLYVRPSDAEEADLERNPKASGHGIAH